MLCDGDGTVFLVKDPIVTGGVATAVAKPIHGEKLWFVEVALDPQATQTAVRRRRHECRCRSSPWWLDDHVISAPIIDSSMKDGTLGVIGNSDEQQAKALASRAHRELTRHGPGPDALRRSCRWDRASAARRAAARCAARSAGGWRWVPTSPGVGPHRWRVVEQRQGDLPEPLDALGAW